MTTLHIIELIAALVAALGSGSLLGVWLTHKRLARKEQAVAGKTEAETTDMDWARFQREIARLEERLEKEEKRGALQGQKIEGLEREVSECHGREARLSNEIALLRGVIQAEGEARQHAQLIVSAERALDRREDGQ